MSNKILTQEDLDKWGVEKTIPDGWIIEHIDSETLTIKLKVRKNDGEFLTYSYEILDVSLKLCDNNEIYKMAINDVLSQISNGTTDKLIQFRIKERKTAANGN